MSDKKNNKKKLLWITLGALGLAIAGTATGVAISKSLSKDKVKDKRESLKEILADKNLSIPSNMKEYLQELSQSESFDNSLNIEDIKSSLINWTVIEKYSKELENEKLNIEFIEFLENASNLKINDVKAEKNNLEKLLNNKNANSITELINNKSKIKELENQLGQFASGTKNSQEDYNQIKVILSKNPPIISNDSIDFYKMTMENDYKANSNLKSSLKNIIDIDSKARELISVANEIKAKETKSEKEQAALIKFANIFNDSNQVKEDKFVDSSLLNDLIVLINEFNDAKSNNDIQNTGSNNNNNNNNETDNNLTSANEKSLGEEKLETKEYIESLLNLSAELKSKYKTKIDNLSTSASVNQIKERAESYNSLVNKIKYIIEESEEVKSTPKYTSATNQNDFNIKFQEVQDLLVDKKLKPLDTYIELDSIKEEIKTLIKELTDLKDELNGDSGSEEIRAFKSEVESKLEASISEKVTNYSFQNMIYSTTITKENKSLFIDENEVDGVELTFKDVFLTDNNVNELNIIYKAKSKTNSNLVVDVTKKIIFTNNFQDKINSISFSHLDEIFDFSYNDLNKYYKSDLANEQKEIKSIFKKKLSSINGFFDYELSQDNIEYKNNKLALQVNFMVNKKVMKKIELLTEQDVSFKDDFWKGIAIEPSEEFRNSKYYNDPSYAYTGNDNLAIYGQQLIFFNTWFVIDILNPAKNTFDDLRNKNATSQIHSLNYNSKNDQRYLTLEELNRVYQKIQSDSSYWSKMFNIVMPEDATYTWVNFDSMQKFKPIGNNAEFKFNITRNNQTKELIVKLNIKKDDDSNQDVKDLNKIRELLEIDNDNKNIAKSAEKILELVTLKQKGKTHNQFNSKDAIKAFNESYNLPKIGKYEIYAKELIEHKNIVNSTVGATAKIFFWIKENGVPIEYKNITTTLTELQYKEKYAKTIQYFKPLTYRDIKPSNDKEWFTSSDFRGDGEIEASDKGLIDSINSSHFEYRRVEGSVISGNNKKLFALVDPKDIVDQKSFEMLNYILKLKINKNNDQTVNEEFSNAKPGTVSDDKSVNSSVSNTDFYTSDDNIKLSSDNDIALDLQTISNNYFMYFYDVTSESDKTLSFKLGFINKQDITKRYTSNTKITLTNLKNDYKENLYPQVMLNRIKLSDFRFDPKSLSAVDFANKVKSNDASISSVFTWSEEALKYNNFTLDPSKITVAEVKNDKSNPNNSIYVKFKYTNPISNKSYKGNNWYKISGLSSETLLNKEELTFENKNLKTILDSPTLVKRERELEPYYKDKLWSFNKEEEKAYWILKEKYIKNTLLKDGASNRRLKLNLFGNILIQDDFRLLRISDPKRNYWFDLDFERLKIGNSIVIEKQTNIYNKVDGSEYPRISFALKATYIPGEGIKFELELKNKEFKLFLGNPFTEAITKEEAKGTRFGEFLKEKAFLINYEGAQVSISYTNSIEHEDFGQETNLFDYKKLDYNQENQPITFFTPEDVIKSDIYNPNQNISYELHNGYLQDQEYIHSSWKNIDLINNIRARSFAYNRGTATQFAKVSNNPNNHKYYIITNNHVQHVSRISDIQGENLAKPLVASYITKTSNNFGNNVDAGFSYWGGLNTANNIPIELIWSGVDQKNKKGEQVNGENVDITIFAVDVKELIKNARREGKFDLALWFENWANLKDTTLDFSGVKKGVYFGQNLKRFGMSGFPYGKQSGYYLNRAASSTATVGLIRQNGYVPTFYNAGNSGTGILGDDNEYISTINSGAPLTFLQSWNNEHSTMNYFGINYDNEHPLDLKNTNSLAAQIIRWHLTKPSEVSMPWFLRDIKKEK